MSGTVVIVIAALAGWCVISVALALLIGRRLRQDGPAVVPNWIRSVRLTDSSRSSRQQNRRPAA